MKLQIFLVLCVCWMSSLTYAGGVSGGGGGGTTNPEPVSAYYIRNMIPKYGVILRVWLQTREASYFNNYGQGKPKEEAILKAVFESDRDIYEALRDIIVHLKMEDSCYDSDGKPSDGSYDPTSPLYICMSPYSMATKLNIYDVDKESTGLLAHEFAHAVGANEEQAVGLQKLLLRDLLNRDFPEMYSNAEIASWDEELFPTALESLNTMMQRGIYVGVEELNHFIYEDLRNLDELTGGHGGINEDEYLSYYFDSLLKAQNSRIELIATYLCTVDESQSQHERADCKRYLDKVFAGKSAVTVREFEIYKGGDDPGVIFDQYLIQKIGDAEELQAEWNQLKDSLEQLQVELRQVANKIKVE